MSQIAVTIVVDTDAVCGRYPDPSQDPDAPTLIAPDLAFAVTTGVPGAGEQDGGVRPRRSRIRIFASSGSDNFEDAVLAIGASVSAGGGRGKRGLWRSVERPAVVPGSSTSPLPAGVAVEAFWFYEVLDRVSAELQYTLRFALYRRDGDTNLPVLFGYFAWESAGA